MEQLRVWLVNEGENLPGDDDNPRLQRMGLLAYEMQKEVTQVTLWQSTFNHYQKKFRYTRDTDLKLTDHLNLKLIHSCGYNRNVCIRRLIHEWRTARGFYINARKMFPPDIIVSAMPTIAQAYFTVKYAKEHNIPVLVDVRDLNPDVFVSPFHGIIRKFVNVGITPLKAMLSHALKNATGLVGTTDPYLQWGLKYAKREQGPNDKVFFVAYPDNGILTQLSKASRWTEYVGYSGIICCFFGQFGQLADFDTLIAAAEKCKTNNIDVQFLLCGKGEYLQHYQEIVEKKRLDNVRLPGWVNQIDITDIGFISDIALLAYKRNDNFNMQMPNKFSESLSLGLAIMLQPTGVMKDVIEANYCGLHYESANELYEALKLLSKNRVLLKQMQNNARNVFEKYFSVSHVYQEYVHFVVKIARNYQK